MVTMTITCMVIMVITTDFFGLCADGKDLAGSGLGLGFGDLMWV